MAKVYTAIPLNGDWNMHYLGGDAFMGSEEPRESGHRIRNAIPGYWEDMMDQFRLSPIHVGLHYNPEYSRQRYPQTGGFLPSMSLPSVYGSFVYTRSFRLADISGQRICLYCGGAQNTVTAWINGRYLGRHEGFSASFSFEVPEDCLQKGENRITLVVSNTRLHGYKGRPISGMTNRAANNCTGGIYGDVALRFYDGSLQDVWVTTDADLQHFVVHREGALVLPATVTIKDGSDVFAVSQIPAGETSVSISADGFTFWSPAAPKRYTAEVTCGNQTISQPFGIRRLTASGMGLLLNGQPFYARGICEHAYFPKTVNPPRDVAFYRNNLRVLKQLGFNFIRFHTNVPMPEYVEAANALGFLMEIETPDNVTLQEWAEILRDQRHHPAPVMYSSGNEMTIDEDYIDHLRQCAQLVHSMSDSLFSPMSAMRGIEYFEWGNDRVEIPFPHDPVRLAKLDAFCDVYNSYSLGWLSYTCDFADPATIDRNNSIYHHPLLSHEICINGTYCDLSLKDRYRGTRIGATEMFSSIEEHLADKGLLDRAPIYYRNSCQWQRRLRKFCIEAARRCNTLSGYDFLGDIDHHCHTFGYHVGMMNEFYEMKPTETPENVRRYNSDTVLLADLPYCVNFESGARVQIPLWVSHYGAPMDKGLLQIRLSDDNRVYLRKELRLGAIPAGQLTQLHLLQVTMPQTDAPLSLKLTVSLHGGHTDAENQWELYLFPKASTKLPSKRQQRSENLIIADTMDEAALLKAMRSGKKVLLFSAGPFPSVPLEFQIALAGRAEGHLASVIHDSPALDSFPHEGFCGWQFRRMFFARTAVLDLPHIPFEPIIEIATTYKNARREAALFEYCVGDGRLLVCTLNLREDDPAARYLKQSLIRYVMSDAFAPKDHLTPETLEQLCRLEPVYLPTDDNVAFNITDIAMQA